MINFQNTQAAHTAQCQKNKPNQKVGKRPKQTFLQRRHTDTGNDAQRRSLLEKSKSKYNEISRHMGQNGHHQKVYKK